MDGRRTQHLIPIDARLSPLCIWCSVWYGGLDVKRWFVRNYPSVHHHTVEAPLELYKVPSRHIAIRTKLQMHNPSEAIQSSPAKRRTQELHSTQTAHSLAYGPLPSSELITLKRKLKRDGIKPRTPADRTMAISPTRVYRRV